MAELSKITRKNKDGSTTVRWRVRWVDKDGARRARNFATKKAADSKLAQVSFRLDTGLKAEGADAGLVMDAVRAWVDGVEVLMKEGKRERSTWQKYEQHMRLHIGPDEIAKYELRKLTTPDCQAFAKRLQSRLSDAMARKVMVSFSSALDEAVRAGTLSANPADKVRIDGRDRKLLSREDAEKQEAAVIPPLSTVRAMIEAAKEIAPKDGGRAYAVFALFTFAGLRISELRGLPLYNIAAFGDAPHVKIRQRADEWGKIGPPKSKAAYRTIPLGPLAVEAVRMWLANINGSEDRLLFATEQGKPYTYHHLYRHVLIPVLERASMKTATTPKPPSLISFKAKVDNDGTPVVRDHGHFAASYCPLVLHPAFGFHILRHVAASLWIAGGANPKRIQKLVGHSKIETTMNIYGHLWQDADDDAMRASGAEAMVMNTRKDQ